MSKKIRIAFVKFGGMSAGGTERWLQMMAANLPTDQFQVDYFYCNAAPYVGSDYKHADTDLSRLQYMEKHGVNLIRFHVGAKDITVPTHDWVDTDFWDYFDHRQYDFVQTAKAGPAEYPYYLIPIPVVEFVALSAGVDDSPNLAWSFHLSQWQRRGWIASGGNPKESSVIPIPALPPATEANLRAELGIPADALVCGFHQRADDSIHSPIPLNAFQKVFHADRHFVIMGASDLYKMQAHDLNLKNVHFVNHSGDKTKISAFLNTLDIFAHGRRDGETFGAVLAEAMAHERPCLSHASLVGNNNAQLETMGPGGLFAQDLDEYCQMLETLFENEELRKKLAQKARTHAERYYSLSACVQKVANTYLQLMGISGNDINSTPPLEYGYSPLGYLQAGDLENSASIANYILTGGIPEHFEIEIVRQILPTIKMFIDVGANIGHYCLVAAKEIGLGGRVYAFEPQPDCCEVLGHTISLNNWEDRLIVHQIALGSESTEMSLYLAGSGSTLDDNFNDNQSNKAIIVNVDTLDSQIAFHGCSQVDFIKIDVEGYELQVLKGAEKTIQEFTPVIFIEIADRIRGREYVNHNYRETLQWLQDRGYRIYKCTEDGRLKKVNPHSRSDHLAMYLCLHKRAHFALVYRVRVWAWMNRFTTKYKPQIRYFLSMMGKAIIQPNKALVSVRGKIIRVWKK